ncbi:MAG TPA: DUF4349 domain-containing protein, partial [Bacteroidia bacterium]|nr:DUF4349 domain-containing protein [Bacteroidia bacterium]
KTILLFLRYTYNPKKHVMKVKLLSLLALLLAFTSCTTRHQRAAAYSSHYNVRYLDDNEEKNKEDHRMMIYDASITVVTKNPDSAAVQVANLAKKYNGYVLSSGNTYTTIRVRSNLLKEALGEISGFGKVKSKTITGTDVTEEFTDYQIRLDNAEKARKRYLELLEKAANVGETLAVEKELERLNKEIDLLKGKMNRISHLVDYSTIHVYYPEKTKPGILGYVFIGLYKGVKWLFVRN